MPRYLIYTIDPFRGSSTPIRARTKSKALETAKAYATPSTLKRIIVQDLHSHTGYQYVAGVLKELP